MLCFFRVIVKSLSADQSINIINSVAQVFEWTHCFINTLSIPVKTWIYRHIMSWLPYLESHWKTQKSFFIIDLFSLNVTELMKHCTGVIESTFILAECRNCGFFRTRGLYVSFVHDCTWEMSVVVQRLTPRQHISLHKDSSSTVIWGNVKGPNLCQRRGQYKLK